MSENNYTEPKTSVNLKNQPKVNTMILMQCDRSYPEEPKGGVFTDRFTQ